MMRVGNLHRRAALGSTIARAGAVSAATLSQMGLINALGIAAVATDRRGIITHWTQAAAELYGRPAEDMIGRPIATVRLAPEDAAIASIVAGRLLARGSWHGEVEIETTDGVPRRLDVRCSVLSDRRRQPTAIAAFVTDLGSPTAPADARRAVPERSTRTHDAGAWDWDPHTDRLLTAQPCTLVRPIRPGELTMRDVLATMPPRDRRRVRDTLAELLANGPTEGRIEFRLIGRDGSIHWLRSRFHAVRDAHGSVCAVRGSADDVTATVLVGERAPGASEFWQATLDSVSAHVAVLGADGVITAVNDRWRAFARGAGRLTDDVGVSYLDICARTDEPLAHEVRTAVEEILAGTRESYEVEYPCDSPSERRWFLLRAVGYERDGTTGAVLAHQDVTKQRAHSRRLTRELRTITWVRRLQYALADESFVLFAQPIIDLADGTPVQSELLLRMRLGCDTSGGGELVLPSAFLHVAEQYGFITRIDRWVIDRAAEAAAAGQAVELNVSARSISDPRLAPHVRRALERTGADPSMMVFEITETALTSDERATRAFAAELHDLGCALALDDFGTGFGSFTYLKQLPIDYLKVDMEFVRDLHRDRASQAVVRAICDLAAGFGLATIAEGVESAATLEVLCELGVDRAQGFHLGRPAPLADLALS